MSKIVSFFVLKFCRVGNSWKGVIDSLVADILLPVLSLLKSNDGQGSMPVEQFWLLRPGAHYNESDPYRTRKQAIDDGATIMSYG